MEMKFKFGLRNKVVIVPMEKLEGTVIEINVNRNGTDYSVRYVHNGDVKTGWFMEDELEKKH